MRVEEEPRPDSISKIQQAKRVILVVARDAFFVTGLAGMGVGIGESVNITRIEHNANSQATSAGYPEVPSQDLQDAQATVAAFKKETAEDLDNNDFAALQQAVERAVSDAISAQKLKNDQANHERLQRQYEKEHGSQKAEAIRLEGFLGGAFAGGLALLTHRQLKKKFPR